MLYIWLCQRTFHSREMGSRCGFKKCYNLILCPETKHSVESQSDLLNSYKGVTRTGSCFISHVGSVLTQVICCYEPGVVTMDDLSLHVLAAMGTSALHLQSGCSLSLEFINFITVWNTFCSDFAFQASLLWFYGISMFDWCKQTYFWSPFSLAHFLSMRLQWDMGQDRLLAQRRHWRGGYHRLPQISPLLLQGHL